MGNILVLGKGGQVANALETLLGERALVAGPDEADFLDGDFIRKLELWVGERPVTAVINAAAYTQVDKAEGDDRELCFRINAGAVGELAAWCRQYKLPLVHYSTDYVFDGSGNRPRREDEPTGPLNAYGDSKLAGEKALAEAGGNHLLLRTSWLYDSEGKNFFNTMLRLMREKDSLNVVSDQIGAPTYAPHIARATLDALERALASPEFPTGTYHVCSGGETSWHGFAQAIYKRLKTIEPKLRCRKVNPIPSSAYPLPARRPLNSRLDCSRAQKTFGITMPMWEEGLAECFAAIPQLHPV